MEKNKEFILNRYSIAIVKCCASCKNKCYDGGMQRLCKKGYGKVDKDFLCKGLYEMNPQLENAGSGNGHVKKREYLMAFANNRGLIDIDSFREKFASKHGSIYMDGK